jgi:hypothetical protein
MAQCTPDPKLTTSGTLPAFLDSAKVGVLYNQVIQYHITKDTTVYVVQLGSTVNAKIDTLWITGVVGMPDGFTYDCHNKDCKIVGGTTGCATLKGTPKAGSSGIYPLLVLITIRATAFIGPLPISQTVSDTNARYSIVVQGAAGTGELVNNDEPILFPNPAKEELQVYVPGLKGMATYSILNLQGQKIQEGNVLGNFEVNHLNLNALSKGIYFLEINSEKQTWKKKFLVD